MLVLDGHKSAVYAFAFSPDGGRLASGDREGNVFHWEDGGPRRLTAFQPDGWATVNDLTFSPAGDRLIAATSKCGMIFFLGAGAGPAQPCVAFGNTGVAFVGNRLVLGVGSRNGPEGGFLVLHTADLSGKPISHSAPKGVRSVSAAGERVAWSEWGRLVYVWDIRKPDRVKLPLPAEAACVALSPDGTQVAAGVDRKVRLFDIERKQERRSLDGHTGRVTGVAFTPDGGTVVSGSWDGTVRLWDATTGQQRAAYKWPVGQVTALAVSPDGLRLAAGGGTGAVVLADLD